MIIYDDISDGPTTLEMAKLKAILDRHPCKASMFQGPCHKGDIFAALRDCTPHQAPSQPRGGTLSLSDILGPVEWDAPPAPDKRESKEMRATRHYTPSPPRKP